MAAYYIVIREQLKDQAGLDIYSNKAYQAMTDKVEFVAGNGKFEAIEGAAPDGVVILRFPDMDEARKWYNSEAYQHALPFRQASAECRVLLVEGVK